MKSNTSVALLLMTALLAAPASSQVIRPLPAPGRAVKQRVVHRLTAHARALDEHAQIGAGFGLANELAQGLRPQGAVGIAGAGFRT